LIHAQGREHRAVFGRGAQQPAPARAHEQQPQQAQYDGAGGDQQQVVFGVAAAQDLHGAGQARRAGGEEVFGTPDRQGHVADDEDQRKGGQQLEKFRRAVQALEHQQFGRGADEAGRQRRQQQAEPVARAAAEVAGEGPGQVHAQHVERTVREVDHARYAKDQRKSGGDQKQRAGVGQAIE